MKSHIEQLKSQGYRITRVREAVLGLFVGAQVPLSVPELLEQLEQKRISANKTTVYREIEFLQEQGIVKAVQFNDDKKRYELSDREHHHHLVCERCEAVEELDDLDVEDELHALQKKIAHKSKFGGVWHTLEFFGLCKGCAGKVG